MYHHKTNKGLLITTDVMDTIETVSVNVLVKTGSRNESAENSGISHYLEHMAFKGTKDRTATDIAQEFDMIGGHFNAYTSHERTVYYAKVLKQDIDVALDILSDIVQNSIFDKQELERERKVILEEFAQTNDLPDEIVFNLFQEKAFPDQALGRKIIGSEEFIKNVTRDDLKNYVSDRYGYNNVIVSAAGNFDRELFIKNVEQKFNSLPEKSYNSELTSKYHGGEAKLYKDLEQVHLVLGFLGAGYLDDDYYVQQVLAIVLGGGMSSRLFQEIREKRGLAYHISSFCSCYQDTGAFSVYSATNESSVYELLEATVEQLKLMAEDVKDEELKRAKAQVKSGLLMAQESSSARAGRIASNYALFDRFITVEEIIEKIESIDKQSIKSMMQKIISSGKKPTFAAVGRLDDKLMNDNFLDNFKL